MHGRATTPRRPGPPGDRRLRQSGSRSGRAAAGYGGAVAAVRVGEGVIAATRRTDMGSGQSADSAYGSRRSTARVVSENIPT